MTRINWGILSTGRIAGVFAGDLAHSRTGSLQAVASRTKEKAAAFAERFGGKEAYGDYESLLDDPNVDAIYIATPHPLHAEWAIRAAAKGKHVLCEKPLTLNHAEAMAVVEAAEENGVFLMEAFMYRCHPQTSRLVETIAGGGIGEPRLIEASFGFDAPFAPASRAYAQELGGGGILDVGCYPVSMARLLAGAALGEPFADPREVSGAAAIGKESRVDEWAACTLKFDGDLLAQLSCGVRLQQENRLVVHGSEGRIVVSNPWIPGGGGKNPTILLYPKGKHEPEEIEIESDRPLYALEADAFAAGIRDKTAPHPAMSPRDTLGNMKTLDRWRQAVGLVYDRELPENARRTVSGRALAPRKDHNMSFGKIPGLDQPVSRLIFGADNQETMPHAAVMFDDFVERGGNCFDTAWIYGSGRCERLLGQWIENRGIRRDVTIVDKGAHTPHCFPDTIELQLRESLDRLKTDFIDLYLLHRDNPEIPAAEFIDALHEQRERGRIRAFGASNWSLARVDEANRHAASRGIPGLVCVSNNFSLAHMIEAPWAGCQTASGPAEREWFRENQIPLLAWSSQARGFFSDTVDRSDPELIRCWHSEDNLQRLERARQMAKEKGVLPINIALAYVLHQPFPTFALIGPRLLSETRQAMDGLGITLSPDEVAWLNLEK